MTSLAQVLLLILEIAQILIIAHVVMSWLVNFNVLSIRQPIVQQIWTFLERLLDPVYSKIREFLPRTGAFDLSPLVLLVAVYAASIIIRNNLI